jgi:hypothetical protein
MNWAYQVSCSAHVWHASKWSITAQKILLNSLYLLVSSLYPRMLSNDRWMKSLNNFGLSSRICPNPYPSFKSDKPFLSHGRQEGGGWCWRGDLLERRQERKSWVAEASGARQRSTGHALCLTHVKRGPKKIRRWSNLPIYWYFNKFDWSLTEFYLVLKIWTTPNPPVFTKFW